VNVELDCGEEIAIREKFWPFSIPVIQLLEGLPLIFIVADQLGRHHDMVPVIVDADVSYLDFLKCIEDLD